jgi:hypothetical protein
MSTTSKLPTLPVVQEDTIRSTLMPLINSSSEVMSNYIEGTLAKIEAENPFLDEMVSAKFLDTKDYMENNGIDENTRMFVLGQIMSITSMIYSLLESQLKADYLNQKFVLREGDS